MSEILDTKSENERAPLSGHQDLFSITEEFRIGEIARNFTSSPMMAAR